MSAYTKKRKVDTEGRGFLKIWASKYLFTEAGSKPTCLVCWENFAVFKDYNLNRHFEMNTTI